MKFSPPSSTLTDDILPGQEQFWQSFDISQPAWYWSTFLMWSRRHKSSHASLTKRTFPVSGFFPGGPDIFWSLRLRSQRCSGWGFKKWDMWGLFCYTNVRKRRNPRGLVWRCTLMEFETQMIKDCPEIKLVVFFHFFFFFCIWDFLFMFVWCQSLFIFVRQEQHKSRDERRIVPKL